VNTTQKLLIGILMIFIVTPVFAQKLGYVNSQRIFSEYQEYIDAQTKLNEIKSSYQKEYDKLNQEYQQLLKTYKDQSIMLSPDRKTEMEKQIETKAIALKQYEYNKLGPQGEFYKKQSEIGAPIMKKINDAINKLAVADGLDFVFDGASGLLYAKPDYDMTQKVLDELNAGLAKKK